MNPDPSLLADAHASRLIPPATKIQSQRMCDFSDAPQRSDRMGSETVESIDIDS